MQLPPIPFRSILRCNDRMDWGLHGAASQPVGRSIFSELQVSLDPLIETSRDWRER
jgi:hypothetical protein